MSSPAPVAARLTHMLTLPVLVDLLLGPYAQAHNCLEEEVIDDVKRGLVDAGLQGSLNAAAWKALEKRHPGQGEAEVLDSLAKAMAKGMRRAVPAPASMLDKMAALFATIDANVGRASDATRAALQSPQGRVILEKSVAAAGEYLTEKLMRERKA